MERDTETDPVIDMTTPGSETDQADGSAAQIPYEDSLVPHVTDDVLDEGYSPPDYPPHPDVPTAAEQRDGESLDQRLAEEEPEPDERASGTADRDAGDAGGPRSGRLTSADDAGVGGDDVTADDAGIAGGAASAEEAAVHTMDEEARND